MELKLRPQVNSVTIKRECPSGALSVECQLDFRTPGGVQVASRTVNSYGTSLNVEWAEETMETGRGFLRSMIKDVESALQKELSQSLTEKDEE